LISLDPVIRPGVFINLQQILSILAIWRIKILQH
jgi:hypothetical protein